MVRSLLEKLLVGSILISGCTTQYEYKPRTQEVRSEVNSEKSPQDLMKIVLRLEKTYFRNEIEKSKLSINDENLERRVVKASQRDGELQMRELTKTAKFEENWAYFPSEGKFYEVGRDESNEFSVTSSFDEARQKILYGFRRQSGSEVELDFIRCRLEDKNSDVIFYHIHPRINYTLEELKENVEKGKGEKLDEDEIKTIEISHKIINSNKDGGINGVPSATDLESMIHTYRDFKNLLIDCKFKFKVVSNQGISTYSLTDIGEKIVYDITESAIYSSKMKWANILGGSSESSEELASKLSDNLVRVEFEKF